LPAAEAARDLPTIPRALAVATARTAAAAAGAPLRGILVSNTVFTFGPLPYYHFSDASPVPIFAAIFAIGLFFALVFWRSGNLALVAVLHGLGDVYIDGTRQL